MKLTLNIDDELLERVRAMTGAKTKTEAIHYALGELDRRHKLRELLAKDDFKLSPREWTEAWEDPGLPEETSMVAETPPPPRERKSRSSR